MANDAIEPDANDQRTGGVIDGGVSVDVGNDGANADPTPDCHGALDPAFVIKRGRGRPRKDRSGEPGSGSAAESRSAAGSGPRTSKASESLDLDVFAKQLIGAHAMAALLLKQPAFNISQDEAKTLAKALREVMKHHKINVAPQTMAYVQLAGCAAVIYGPRVAIMLASKSEQKKQQTQLQPVPVPVNPQANPGMMRFN